MVFALNPINVHNSLHCITSISILYDIDVFISIH